PVGQPAELGSVAARGLTLAEHEHIGRDRAPSPHPIPIPHRLEREQIIRAAHDLAWTILPALELLIEPARDVAACELLVVDLRVQLSRRRDQDLAALPDRRWRLGRWRRRRRCRPLRRTPIWHVADARMPERCF